MEAHLIDTHLLGPRSRSSAKVKAKYQGHVSQKMDASGALVFHEHILFYRLQMLSILTSLEFCRLVKGYLFSGDGVHDWRRREEPVDCGRIF